MAALRSLVVLLALVAVASAASVATTAASVTTTTASNNAAAAAAPKQVDIKTLVSQVVANGTALPAQLKQQWAARVAQVTKNITAAEKVAEGKYKGEQLKAVQASFKVLSQVQTKILANFTAFATLQNTQTVQLVKNYTTILNARLSSKSTEEQPIHALRAAATATMNSWVPALSKVQEYAHQAFEAAFRAQATLLAKSYKNPVNDQVREAVTDAGVQLLQVLVQEQNADTNLLTTTQFNTFQNFFQKSEDALIRLLVAAKNNRQA